MLRYEAKPYKMFTKEMRLFTLTGFFIGLSLVSLFLFTAGEPNPEWPSYWRTKPLVITPIAGALAGFFCYWIRTKMRRFGNWLWLYTILAIVFSFPLLWIGFILGLDGTYWN